MTQEEKARAYDEVREKIAIRFGSNVAEEIFSQFEMSEDERIRKALIKVFASHKDYEVFFGVSVECILAWLEKHGKQKPAENSGKKSEDVIEEKDMTEYKKGFECGKQRVLKYPEDFNLCKKSAWSEEDEARFESCIKVLQTSDGYDTINAKWLKSLKDRYTWKPSDEQIEALDDFIYAKYPNIEKYGAAVKSLYQDLKKLREEYV